MIVIWALRSGSYTREVIIDEEAGKVLGSTELADEFRRKFDHLRDHGVDPAEQMEGIKDRLYANYRNVYYWAV